MSSAPTTPMSQASTRYGIDNSINLDDLKGLRQRAVKRVKQVSTSQDLLVFLVAFRILNALSIKTFFQPDEFFQSLEPAWEIAFGSDSGAWITWVRETIPQSINILMPCEGMEEPPSIRYTSCPLLCRLPTLLRPRLGPAIVPEPSRRLARRSAKDCPRDSSCAGGLLYLEARRADIWDWEQ